MAEPSIKVTPSRKRGRPAKSETGTPESSDPTITDIKVEAGTIPSTPQPQKRRGGNAGKRSRSNNSNGDVDKELDTSITNDETEARPKRQRKTPAKLKNDLDLDDCVSNEKDSSTIGQGDVGNTSQPKKRGRQRKSYAPLNNSKSDMKVSELSDHEEDATVNVSNKKRKSKRSEVNPDDSNRDSDMSGSEDSIEDSQPRKRGRQGKKGGYNRSQTLSDNSDEDDNDLTVKQTKRRSVKTLNESDDSEADIPKSRRAKSTPQRGRGRRSIINTDISKGEDEIEGGNSRSLSTPGRRRGRPPRASQTPRPRGKVSMATEESSDEEEADTWTPQGKKKGKQSKTSTPKGKIDLTCQRCQETLSTLPQLKSHLMKSHNAVWTSSCPEGKTDNAALKTILNANKKLTCLKCGKEIRFIHYYNKHIQWCGREDEKFTCEVCNGEIMLMWKREHELVHVREKRREEERKEMKELKSKNAAETVEDENSEKNTLGRTKRSAAKKAQNIMHNITTSKDQDGDKSNDDDDSDASINSEEEENDDDDDDDDIGSGEDGDEIDEEGPLTDEDSESAKTPRGRAGRRPAGYMFTFENHLNFHEKQEELGPVFADWKPKKSNWILKNESEMVDYLPKEKESVEFSVCGEKKVPKPSEICSLKRFEGAVIRDSINFFVGGPVWGLAWCPTPYNKRTTQYLALSCHKDMDALYQTKKTYQETGSIQIWSMRKLDYNLKTLEVPRLEFLVAHDHGAIRGLEWCPHNCWEPGTCVEDDMLPRIGLLAAACSDGSVIIFSIPNPISLSSDKDTETLHIYKPAPTLVLLPWHPSKAGETSQCLCVSWQTPCKQQHILAGYADGSVRIWDLYTKSPLLRVATDPVVELLPCRTLLTNLNCVMSCEWSPHVPGYFATGSRDRTFQIWHMDHPSAPWHKAPTMMTVSIQWPHHVLSCWHSLDDSYSNIESYIRAEVYDVFLEDKDVTLSEPMISISSCIWDFSCSNWLMECLGGNGDGHLGGTVVPEAKREPAKKPCRRRRVVYNTKMKERTVQKNNINISDTAGTANQSNDEKSNGIANQNTVNSSQSNQTLDHNFQSESKSEETPDVNHKGMKNKGSSQKGKKGKKKLSDVSVNDNDMKTKTVYTSYRSAAENHYLQFTDPFTSGKEAKMTGEDNMGRTYLLAAIYRVQFNPNLHSCSWVASAGQTGIVRLHNIFPLIESNTRRQLENACQKHV